MERWKDRDWFKWLQNSDLFFKAAENFLAIFSITSWKKMKNVQFQFLLCSQVKVLRVLTFQFSIMVHPEIFSMKDYQCLGLASLMFYNEFSKYTIIKLKYLIWYNVDKGNSNLKCDFENCHKPTVTKAKYVIY